MLYVRENAPRMYPGIMKEISRPWEEVLHRARKLALKRGTLFSLSGGDLLKMAYVRRGKVSIAYSGRNGEPHINLFYEGGSFFNESVALSGVCHQIQTARCLEDTDLYLFDVSLIKDTDFRSAHHSLLENLLLSCALKVVNFHALLNVICTKKTFPLICWYIATMSEAHGGSASFAPNITQREVAMLLGIDMSSMTRAIRALKHEGIVHQFTKRQLIIHDQAALRELAEA